MTNSQKTTKGKVKKILDEYSSGQLSDSEFISEIDKLLINYKDDLQHIRSKSIRFLLKNFSDFKTCHKYVTETEENIKKIVGTKDLDHVMSGTGYPKVIT